jgi:Uma2 family endonuclease
MGGELHGGGRATIEAFRAFVDERPDWVKWELIDGKIVETYSSSRRHQVLIGRLLFELETGKRAAKAPWQSFMGIGTRVPGDRLNEIVPDVMVMTRTDKVIDWTYDVLATFEVTAPETFGNDMVHKRSFYTPIDSLTHYVVLARDRCEATVFARPEGFSPRVLKGASAKFELAPLGVSLLLADIYGEVLG